jgi:hypothetical protein
MSSPERVRFTVSPDGGAVLADELSLELSTLFGLAASVRRVPAASVGLKPWPLILSVIKISGAVAPSRAYRQLAPGL